MNIMTGVLSWSLPLAAPELQAHSFRNGPVSVRVDRLHGLKSDDRCFHLDPATGVLCGMLGNIYESDTGTCSSPRTTEPHPAWVQPPGCPGDALALEQAEVPVDLTSTGPNQPERALGVQARNGAPPPQPDVQVVARLYATHGLDFVNRVDGTFLVLLLDQPKGTACLVQSRTGYLRPVYYRTTRESFAFSTSLRQLLRRIAGPRELDIQAAHDFLYFERVIANESTLVKGVSKLMPHEYALLDLNAGTFRTLPLRQARVSYSRAEAKRDLIGAVRHSVATLRDRVWPGPVALTVTSGFDCNLILWSLRQVSDQPVTAVTISGGGNADETPTVNRILSRYSGIRHGTGTVGTDVAATLPDLAWITEGYVFETGIFLRHELGRILRDSGCTTVFLGACADQVMSSTSLLNRFDHWLRYGVRYRFGREKRPEKALRIQLKRNARTQAKFNASIDYNAKMHELVLNSFGVQGLYPFLDRRVAALAAALGKVNRHKRFYKAKIARTLPPEIAAALSKSRAAVDTACLFRPHAELLLRVLDTPLARTLLAPAQLDILRNHPLDCHKTLLQLAYLHAFNELFLTARFDALCNCEHVDVRLDALLP